MMHPPGRLRLILAGALFACLVGVFLTQNGFAWGRWPDPTDPRTTLAEVEAAVTKAYPGPEMTVDAVRAPEVSRSILLVDVREPDEFAQSHIAGAIRVAPSATPTDLLRALPPDLAGRPVVLYCAVGVRSGDLASRARATLQAAGSGPVYNLRGGIFRWYVSGAPLQNASGAVSTVHPYDRNWQKLLQRSLPQPSAPRPN